MPVSPLKKCPRCGGRLLMQEDGSDVRDWCMACGFAQAGQRSPEGSAVLDLIRHPAHGKGKRRFFL